MKANSWLYHYYMVQSRLQYSLAYGGQSPSALAAAFYPQMAPGYPGSQHFGDNSSMLHAHPHSAFLAATQSSPYSSAAYTGYTPPPGAYQLPAVVDGQGGESNSAAGKDRASESPLDFSSAGNSGSFTEWQQDGSNDDVIMRNLGSYGSGHGSAFVAGSGSSKNKAFPVNGDIGGGGLERSSPEYVDESSSSTSPLQMTSLDSGNIITGPATVMSSDDGPATTALTASNRENGFDHGFSSGKQTLLTTPDFNQNVQPLTTVQNDFRSSEFEAKPSPSSNMASNPTLEDQKKSWARISNDEDSESSSESPNNAKKE